MKKQACIPYPLLCLCALLLIAVIGWQMLPALSESDTAVPAFEPLEYGASGELVSYVQQRLSELGYYDGKISGNFLEGTRNCLKRLQKDYGLEITGKLDEETWQLLLTAQYRVLKNGDDGDEVARLHRRDRNEHFRFARLDPDLIDIQCHRAREIGDGLLVRPLLENLAEAQHEHDGACGVEIAAHHRDSHSCRIKHGDGKFAVQ